ncbi:secreted RxLR effector protein 161-like [Telopea speciosissima]|uniref:secreted RxLR effector protein 161-like n=1 Tax=Telopea speciosissima TaxID=54955 RepID=UPI001CC4AF3C|nr:secreted RxLR effector protein 161-like [Telopea speciosissima]
MKDCKPVSTPMMTECKLTKDDVSSSVNHTTYRSTIRSFLYLTASRPDILQAVCMVARFQAGPKETHVAAVKRIFRYLKDTSNYGMWYPKTKDHYQFIQMQIGQVMWMIGKAPMEVHFIWMAV